MNEKDQDMIDAFMDSVKPLDKIMQQVSEEGLDWAEKPGEWSIREVLHHLAEDCNVYAFIIEQALATPGCKVFFGEFPGNQAWGKQLAWRERPVNIALEMIHVHREFLADLVGHFPDRWEYKVNFYDHSGEKIGESTVAQMMTMLTEHMSEHVEMIHNIIAVNQ